MSRQVSPTLKIFTYKILFFQWLLDIGSDFHRRCYGNFFTCDDQKGSRRDNKNYEEPDLCMVTNYEGYVAWGEYPFAFAACLEQEECYR